MRWRRSGAGSGSSDGGEEETNPRLNIIGGENRSKELKTHWGGMLEKMPEKGDAASCERGAQARAMLVVLALLSSILYYISHTFDIHISI